MARPDRSVGGGAGPSRGRLLRLRVRRSLAWLLRLRGSPQAIARGVAIGLLVGFTPTVGFQTLLALAVATLLGANRPAAMLVTWMTNPLTMVPLYGLTYALGGFFWSGPEASSVASAMRDAAGQLATLDFLELRAQLQLFAELGLDVLVVLWIGGLIAGGVAAAIAYPLTLRGVVQLRERQALRRLGRGPRGALGPSPRPGQASRER